MAKLLLLPAPAAVLLLLLQSFNSVQSICHASFPLDIITPAHFFNVSRMAGTWYNSAVWSIVKENTQPNFKCLSYNISSDESATKIKERLVYLDKPEEVSEINHDVQIETIAPLPAIWQLLNAGTMQRSGRIVWIQTTYENWALEHYCYFGTGYMRLWLRSPSYQLDTHTQTIINEVARGYGFPMENLIPVQNINCPNLE